MPLRTSAESQLERAAIESEWDTERSYSLANLSTARRAGLSFVKATRTDDEWTAHSRAGLDANLFNKIKTSEDIAKQNAEWYRELVGGSGSATPVLMEASTSSRPVERAAFPVPANSESILLNGQGSSDAPYTLDDDSDLDEPVDDTVSCPKAALPENGMPAVLSLEDAAVGLLPEGDEAAAMQEDMYCLLCKALVPASDVPGHTSSILHQLSKDPNFTGKTPLVPPTSYGIKQSNLGYGMLQRLGWVEDTGLGSSLLGRKTPVRAIEKFDRKGVGVGSRKKLRLQEDEGKVVKNRRAEKPMTARPLAKNRRELETSKKREMIAFKEGLAYLNS